MNYLFKTSVTMKKYNQDKYWIDSNYIDDIVINAIDLKDALKQYKERVNNDHYNIISDTALKNKRPMYIDTTDGKTKQIGYVITGAINIDKSEYNTGQWVKQYIDLWVRIQELREAF